MTCIRIAHAANDQPIACVLLVGYASSQETRFIRIPTTSTRGSQSLSYFIELELLFEIFRAQLMQSAQFLYFMKREGTLTPGKSVVFCLASDSRPAPFLILNLKCSKVVKISAGERALSTVRVRALTWGRRRCINLRLNARSRLNRARDA